MSTNISKQKRDALLDKINQIKNYISAAPQDENTANLLTYIGELTKEINGKKYGLVFEEHREKIDELLEENAPVLVEQEDLFIDNGGEMNFLIEGDNLVALKLLEKTHKGKIDVIYIDPPYNTGANDFIYDDNYVDNNDLFKHSKWSSFIKKRLNIAKSLLKQTGAIFISIDDNEISALKLICDDVFGETNLLGITSVAKGTTTGQDAKKFGSSVDYLLAYGMKDFELSKSELTNEDKKRFNKTDSKGLYSILQFRKTGNGDRREDRPNLYYPLTAPDNSIIYPIGPTGYESRWRGDKEFWNKMIKEDMVEWVKQKDGWKPYIKFYLDGRGKAVSNLWNDIEGNKKATIELKNVLGEKKFTNPKPTDLIRKILKISDNPFSLTYSSTILDFFAGSGTTGHAVMKLNAEDDGNRKFILCTNNENNICQDVTYQRLKTVITGKRKDGSDYDENYKASLKYFKIDYLPIKDKMYYEYADELLEHVKELVELENAIDFNTNKSVAIVLDDDELDDFVENIADYPKCKTLYMGHDVLTSYQQEQTIKAHGITINTVPDYYYRDLAN